MVFLAFHTAQRADSVADLLFADFLGCGDDVGMWADIFCSRVVIICFILKTEAVFPSNLHLFS
jgi:hypothetical protein